jgi:hypothetical protein
MKDTKQFQGKWIYRSLRNNKVLNTPFNDLRFGEGVIDFKKIAGDQIVDSSLDMGSGFILNLQGEVSDAGTIVSLKWRGTGVPASPTEGWIYDYQAFVAPTWEEATDKTITLVGSVLRTVAHGSAPAGVTGTFYMVKLD